LSAPVFASYAKSREPFFSLSRSQVTENGVPVDHGAGPDGDVECVRRDFLSPDGLAVEIEGGDDGGAEHGVDALAITSGSRRGIAAAQIGELPRPGGALRVPKARAVLRREADHLVLRILLLRNARWPVGESHEDALAPDDGAGLILIAASDVGLLIKRHLPDDVRLIFAAPGN